MGTSVCDSDHFKIMGDKNCDGVDEEIIKQHGLADEPKQNIEIEKFVKNYGQIFQEHPDDFMKNSYGTRSTSLILVFQDKSFRVVEKSLNKANNLIPENVVLKSVHQ